MQSPGKRWYSLYKKYTIIIFKRDKLQFCSEEKSNKFNLFLQYCMHFF